MNALKDHYFSIQRSFSLLFKGRFLLYFLPGLLLAFLFLAFSGGLSLINSSLGFLGSTPWIGNYISTAINTTFGWIYGASLFFYQFIILLVYSPFNTLLSQKIEAVETGQEIPFDWIQIFKDILRLIGIVVIWGILYLLIYLVWTILAWILGLSFLSPFVSLILVGFFTGFNSYDYSLERHKINVISSWGYAFRHPLHLILTGLLFTLLLYIPIIGVAIAPVLLTMVGTLNYLRIKKRIEDKQSPHQE